MDLVFYNPYVKSINFHFLFGVAAKLHIFRFAE